MGNASRKQALWMSRNRAFKRLAAENKERFIRLRDEELERLGEPPISEFQDKPTGEVRYIPAEEVEQP